LIDQRGWIQPGCQIAAQGRSGTFMDNKAGAGSGGESSKNAFDFGLIQIINCTMLDIHELSHQKDLDTLILVQRQERTHTF